MPTWKEIREEEREHILASLNEYFAPARLHMAWLVNPDGSTEDFHLADEDGDGVDISCIAPTAYDLDTEGKIADEVAELIHEALFSGHVPIVHSWEIDKADNNQLAILSNQYARKIINKLFERPMVED